MTSILHLAGYAISKRAQMRVNKISRNQTDVVIPCKCEYCVTIRRHAATKKRLERNKARAFLVVTHKIVTNSKCAVILSEDLKDEHEVLGAFHQLKIAKSVRDMINASVSLAVWVGGYNNAIALFAR